LWPCIPTDLTHAPLLDEAIKELQDNLVGITPYGRKISLLPGSPPDPRAPEEIRLARRARNQRNTFVKLLSLYPCMQAVALNLDMQRLKAIAYYCTQ
jgi:hypothetical protein